MTTQDIALIREIISKAKDVNIGKLVLDFADEIDKLKLEKADKNDEKASLASGISNWVMLFHSNSFGELLRSLRLILISGIINVIYASFKIAGMITRKKYVQPIYKNIEKSLIMKGNTLKQQLDEFYISKMLNDLPDELSESLDIYNLQDYLDNTKLDEIVSSVFYKFDDLVSEIECQTFSSHFSESDNIIEELQKLKEEAKKIPECIKEYEQTIKKVEKKIERDERADVVCFNNLQKYGLEFKDGWDVDKDGKRIVEAKNFRSIYWTGMHLGYLKLYDKYEKLFMDKDGNILGSCLVSILKKYIR